MSSLFSEYKKERENKTVIETTNVLCVYSIDKQENALYVEDIFVKKENRKQGLARKTMDFLFSVAKTNSLGSVVTSIVPSAHGSDYSLVCLMKYGFRLRSSHENIIFLKKDL